MSHLKLIKSPSAAGLVTRLVPHARGLSALTLLAFLVVGGLAARALPKLRTEYSVRQFLPDGHPLMKLDEETKQRFQLVKIEPFYAIITLGKEENGTWLEKERIAKLRAVTEELRPLDGVDVALSLPVVDGATGTKKEMAVGGLLALTPESEWKNRVLGDPVLTPNLITPDARTTLLMVGMKDVSTERYQQIQDETRARLHKAFPSGQVALGGIPAVQTQMGALLADELKNFLGLSLLVSILTLVLFFRSISSVAVPLVLMVLANVISLAWMAWAGVSFTVLSATLPVLVTITVMSMATHTMLRYASDWEWAKRNEAGADKVRVLLRSYRGLLLPNFLTAVTTSIGFFAIAFGQIPLIRQYGLTVGVSIFVCWVVVIGALLPLLVLFPVPEARDWTARRARWALFVTRRKWETIGLVSALTLMAFWLGRDLNWSARLFDDLPTRHEARATTDFVDASMGGIVPLDLVIESSQENAWNDPTAVRNMAALAARWRMDPDVGSVTAASDLYAAAGRVQGKGLPATRQEAAEYGFLYTLSSDSPLKQYMTSDGRAARISLRLHDIPGNKMAESVRNFTLEAEKAFPGWKVQAAGMATTVHVLNNELCTELIYGFWQAMALIALFLLVAFRSLRWTLVSLVPNLVSPAFLLGALHLFGTPIKPGIALIFSIALGISFDNTVYLLGRLKLLRERTGKISVDKAWYQEANLCLFSSFALASGFLVFLASYFALNRLFGAYMLVSILGGLVGDLVLLPALLAAFPWMVSSEKKKPRLTLVPAPDSAPETPEEIRVAI